MRLEPIILELEREENDLLIIAHESVLRVLYGYLMACNAQDIPSLEFPRNEIIEIIPASYNNIAKRIHIPDLPEGLIPPSPEGLAMPAPPSGTVSPMPGRSGRTTPTWGGARTPTRRSKLNESMILGENGYDSENDASALQDGTSEMESSMDPQTKDITSEGLPTISVQNHQGQPLPLRQHASPLE